MPPEERTDEDRLTLPKIYEHVLNTRNMEIELFWKRCNYFLVLNTGLALAYFNVTQSQLQVPVTLLGVIVSILWLQVALGSKFWQERWEECLWSVEEELINEKIFDSKHRLFSLPTTEAEARVANSLGRARHAGAYRLFDALILRRPSVTFAMMLLVVTFLVSWTLLLGYRFFAAISLPVTGY